MEDDERDANASAEPTGAMAVTGGVDGDVAMEDATSEIAAPADALVVENDGRIDREEADDVDADVASVASDATVDLEQMEEEEVVVAEEQVAEVEDVEEVAMVVEVVDVEEETVVPMEEQLVVADVVVAVDPVSAPEEAVPAATQEVTTSITSKDAITKDAAADSATTHEAPATDSDPPEVPTETAVAAPELPAVASEVDDNAVPPTNQSSSSSDSSDSSSSDSSSSSSDSSDSEVEDVTDQYKKPVDPDAPHLRTMSESGDDEVDAEQWFDEPTLEDDGVEVVGVVEAPPRDVTMDGEEDEEEDVFLTPFKPELERGSATKRRRRESGDEDQDGMEVGGSAGEETTSSEPDMISDDEFGHRRKSSTATSRRKKTKIVAVETHRRKNSKAVTPRPVKMPQPLDKPLVFKRVPAKYDIFDGVPNDDSNFPFLKGDYHIRDGHRAFFTGYWGFTDADFKKGGFTSKFEYTSGYLHGRRESDRRPFSGTYGGYFNLRQFSGKITKIKEDRIQLCFVRLRERDENNGGRNIPSEHEEEEDDDDDGVNAQYEVFGEGKNRYGHFLVRGYFSATTGRMTVRRRYLD